MSFPGIYVTGNVVVDTLVRPADRLPEWGSTTCVDAIAMRLGGNASGAACAAAMMGVPARIAGMVGADAQGAYARARLEECGVDTTRLAVHPRQPTAATVGLIHSGGERLFFHVSGACGVFSPADISFERTAVEGCAFFHYGSVFCLPAMRKHAAEILRRAREAGLIVSLDTDWDTEGQWAELIDPLCGLIDYLLRQHSGRPASDRLKRPAGYRRAFARPRRRRRYRQDRPPRLRRLPRGGQLPLAGVRCARR